MASPLSKPLTNKVLYKRLSFLNFVLPVLLAFLVSSLFALLTALTRLRSIGGSLRRRSLRRPDG